MERIDGNNVIVDLDEYSACAGMRMMSSESASTVILPHGNSEWSRLVRTGVKMGISSLQRVRRATDQRPDMRDIMSRNTLSAASSAASGATSVLTMRTVGVNTDTERIPVLTRTIGADTDTKMTERRPVLMNTVSCIVANTEKTVSRHGVVMRTIGVNTDESVTVMSKEPECNLKEN